MASLALLLIWAGILTLSEGSKGELNISSNGDEIEEMLERGSTWLWNQRNKDYGWSNDTHRVLLALRLANLSQIDMNPTIIPIEMNLSSKQMELEIALLLWRHRELGFSAVNLARYTLTLNALCMDPRQFHGHDLIGTLQHHEPPRDYDFALVTLASCSADAHIRKRQIRRLLDIANIGQYNNIDTISMVILALRCIVQDDKHRNLHHYLRRPLFGLGRRQRSDGSFGDIRTTALAMQALEVENESMDHWNKTAALMWLMSNQQPNGSFSNDVYTTAETILAIIPKSIASIRTLNCRQTNESNSHIALNEDVTADIHDENLISSSTSLINLMEKSNDNETNSDLLITTTAKSTIIKSTPLPTPSTPKELVNVSYTLWIGTNESYHLIVNAIKNETFYGVMLKAADTSPHFKFSAAEWPNGHYVHTIAGYKEEPMSYHFWLLYRLPTLPDLTSPPGNQFVAPGGVDDLEVSDGEHYLFWYKKL